ncbi:MAG: response regulator [Chitinophagaceae bacterium]|nr:response regulator [Oligoflexus sp.]
MRRTEAANIQRKSQGRGTITAARPSAIKSSQARRLKLEGNRLVDNEISLDQLRLQFLANMNHELRTPLHGMMGATELLSLTNLDCEQKHYLSIMKSTNQQLLELVENILDFSKMISGQLTLQKNRFDIKQVLLDAYQHFLPFAKKKSLQFAIHIDENIPRWIYADAQRLSQIVYHLLGNAMKFTHQGGVILSLKGDEKFITLSVVDTGVGIPEAKKDLIFEAFYQEDSSHTRKYGGAGLGLTIARFLANAMEGKLEMNSDLNRGSDFFIRFPYLIAPEAIEMNRNKEGTRQPRILLVEDNEINQAIVYLLFSKRGIQIDIAQDGLEGLNTHRRNHYDLIFMDMQMPVMDGVEATREIRKFDPDVQIIALTANLCTQDKQKGLEAGMNDFLCKPLNHDSLEKLLEQARKRISL